MLIREVTGAVHSQGRWRRLDRLSPLKLLSRNRHDHATRRRRGAHKDSRLETEADGDHASALAIRVTGTSGVAQHACNADSAGTEPLSSQGLPPCLVVHGDRDPICPLAQARQLTSNWAQSAPCSLAVVPFGFHGLTSVLASMGSMASYLGVATRGTSLVDCCVEYLERRFNNDDVGADGSNGSQRLESECKNLGTGLCGGACTLDSMSTPDAATAATAAQCALLAVMVSALSLCGM